MDFPQPPAVKAGRVTECETCVFIVNTACVPSDADWRGRRQDSHRAWLYGTQVTHTDVTPIMTFMGYVCVNDRRQR